MSASHARTGVCAVAVTGTVGLLPWSNPPAVLLAAGLVVGGSIAPDLDHDAAAPSRAFGPVTRLLSAVVQAVSALAYTVTRADGDPAARRAHRTLTHSAVGCVAAGVGFGWLCSITTPYGPIPAAVAVGLITGLGVHALMGAPQWKRRDGQLAKPRRGRRRRRRPLLTRAAWKWSATLLSAALVLATPSIVQGWWPWWLGAALTLGMAVHCAGDAVTDVGVPWCWPLLSAGRRWRHRWLLPAPLRFTTQRTGERVAVVLVSAATVGFCALVWTGPVWWPHLTGDPTPGEPVVAVVTR